MKKFSEKIEKELKKGQLLVWKTSEGDKVFLIYLGRVQEFGGSWMLRTLAFYDQGYPDRTTREFRFAKIPNEQIQLI